MELPAYVASTSTNTAANENANPRAPAAEVTETTVQVANANANGNGNGNGGSGEVKEVKKKWWQKKGKDDKPKEPPKPKVGFFKLFRYATGTDYALMAVGSLCAIAAGR